MPASTEVSEVAETLLASAKPAADTFFGNAKVIVLLALVEPKLNETPSLKVTVTALPGSRPLICSPLSSVWPGVETTTPAFDELKFAE